MAVVTETSAYNLGLAGSYRNGWADSFHLWVVDSTQIERHVIGPTLWILFNVIRNLLESWLDSRIPDVILEIPAYQIRRSI